MKLRDDSVHRPKLRIADMQMFKHVTLTCTVCGAELGMAYYNTEAEKDGAIRMATIQARNYCPICGARLRETENGDDNTQTV